MRKTGLTLALVAGLGLAGCASTPGGTPTVDPTQVAVVISDVQNTAAKICGFVPTASTVSSIIATFIPGATSIVDTANQVATMICNAVVPPKSLKRRVGAPMVGDIKVEGYFIR